MGIILQCGACGAPVGEASHEDNYQHRYYKIGSRGQIVCPNCGCGEKSPLGCLVIPGIILFIMLIIGLCMSCSTTKSFKQHKKPYVNFTYLPPTPKL